MDSLSTLEQEADERLPQPSTSKISAVINGMGNGATLGMATYALPKIYAQIMGKPVPATNIKGTIFATILGTALGNWYGLHEAKQLEKYRDQIGQEIIGLRKRVHTLEKQQGGTYAEQVAAGNVAADVSYTR